MSVPCGEARAVIVRQTRAEMSASSVRMGRILGSVDGVKLPEGRRMREPLPAAPKSSSAAALHGDADEARADPPGRRVEEAPRADSVVQGISRSRLWGM